jgi:hypothetical protein
MAAYVKFEAFTEIQLTTPVDWNTDTIKLALTNTAPNAATGDFFNDITEIGAGNGYTAGGNTLSISVSRSGGVTTITATDSVFTASGGSIGPFRYVIMYKSTGTASTSPLVAYWDYGSSITLLNGETFTADIGAGGLFTLT